MWTNSGELDIGFYGDDSFINLATDGKLALFGDGGGSLVEFLGLIDGTDAVRYGDVLLAAELI